MNSAHQVEYFLTRTPHGMAKRYERLVGLWALDQLKPKVVADIGCGAYGGIFCVRKYERMIGIDALMPCFNQTDPTNGKPAKPFNMPQGVEAHEGYFGLFGVDFQADVIVCADALNYYEHHRRFAKEVVKHLAPDGHFFLHMNLRTREQMNENHPYYFTEKDIDKAFSGLGLRQMRRSIYKTDPTNGKDYKTYVGEWHRE
jgi:2-polyprenyl-3-methyl-5-hydroxy-6-metoxy-1,4-benzoquinol methylase